MLYTVTLTYIEPMEIITSHLETHKEWLVRYIKAGNILAAGPMEPATAGIVLVHCASKEELDAILQADSFYQNNLVAYDVRAFVPALRAEIFLEQWAANAKPVPVDPTG
jgi:uncharacterized protein YciI